MWVKTPLSSPRRHLGAFYYKLLQVTNARTQKPPGKVCEHWFWLWRYSNICAAAEKVATFADYWVMYTLPPLPNVKHFDKRQLASLFRGLDTSSECPVLEVLSFVISADYSPIAKTGVLHCPEGCYGDMAATLKLFQRMD